MHATHFLEFVCTTPHELRHTAGPKRTLKVSFAERQVGMSLHVLRCHVGEKRSIVPKQNPKKGLSKKAKPFGGIPLRL